MAFPDMVRITVKDIAKSLEFYRLLGMDIPEYTGEDHFEVITPNGYRIAWDTEAMIQQIDPDWQMPRGQRIGLAFKCANPAEVDVLYAKVIAAGHGSKSEPWDAVWGQRYAVV